MGENIGDPCFLCSLQMSNQGQQFVVRSEIFETFWFLDQCQLSPEKKKSMYVLPSWITHMMKVLHFKHKMGWKDWFSSISKGFIVKKRPHLTYIYRTYMITFKQGEKRAERLQLPGTALPKDQMWMADGESDHWSLVMQLHIFRNKCGSKTLL